MKRWQMVGARGTAQALAWASSYYLPAMLAKAMAEDLRVSVPTVFAAFSAALLVAAFLGPFAGRAIDRWGGRPVLMTTNIVFALGLIALGASQGPIGLFAAWFVIGIAMGSGLYEAAFATLVRLYGVDSRNAITGIALIAGFSSTVGWPLSAFVEAEFGWRAACWSWALLHLALGLPLHAAVPRARSTQGSPRPATAREEEVVAPGAASTRAAVLLALVFAITWFISTAMAAHLPGLLMAGGMSLAAAVAVGALVGPAQVGGRLLEFGVLRRLHPLLSARLAALMHPIGAGLLLLVGAPAAAAFAVLHGAGNGILTIANGTLPLMLFGPHGYGERQGLLMAPGRIMQAFSPWLFGVWLAWWGVGALWLSGALGLAAFAALLMLPRRRKQTLQPDAPCTLGSSR
jgi:MFS family permease